MAKKNLAQAITEAVVGAPTKGSKAKSTPANASLAGDPPAGESGSTKAGSTITAKGGVKPMPAVATDVEVKNKDAKKVSHQTSKAKEPQAAPKTGEQVRPTQGSSKVRVPEDVELEGDDQLLEDDDVIDGVEFEDLDEEEFDMPETRAGKAKLVFDLIRTMDRDELTERFGPILDVILNEEDDEDHDDDDDDEDDDKEANEEAAAIRAKVTSEDIDVSADVEALLSSDDSLSEEFKGQAAMIFEAAVVAKINEEVDRLEADFRIEIAESHAALAADMQSKLDGYLDYVVEQWMEDNALAVESGIRTEITEDFIGGLKDLFNQHYIDLPEDKVDVVAELANQIGVLEDRLNESIETNIDLRGENTDAKKLEIIYALSDGLADTELEKLAGLAEGVSYENEDQFEGAIATLKESYFPDTVSVSVEEDTDELLSESLEHAAGSHSSMDRYTSALSRPGKR